MSIPLRQLQPLSLADIGAEHPLRDVDEIRALTTLRDAGDPELVLAPFRIVPPEAEERFYKLNNLPAQLRDLFAEVDPEDPDEDDIEELSPDAQKLISSHYLLDEFIDVFYDGIAALPGQVRVRHPFGTGYDPEGDAVVRGRPALIALKRLWASAWEFEVLMDRLEHHHTIALDPHPVIITAAGLDDAPADLERRASDLLERDVVLKLDNGHITRVGFRD